MLEKSNIWRCIFYCVGKIGDFDGITRLGFLYSCNNAKHFAHVGVEIFDFGNACLSYYVGKIGDFDGITRLGFLYSCNNAKHFAHEGVEIFDFGNACLSYILMQVQLINSINNKLTKYI